MQPERILRRTAAGSQLGALGLLLAVMAAVLGVFATPSLAQTEKPVVTGARVAGDETRTRFVLDMDRQVTPVISGLASPYRLIIDLPEVSFSIPGDAGKAGRGLVADWRFGLFAVGKSRVVMDLKGPVEVDKTFFLPSVDDQPARLVVDLVSASPDAFAAFVEKSRSGRAEQVKKTAPKSDRLTDPKNKEKPLIVLDPGHGGIDNGATGVHGTLEKAIVLEFAKLLKTRLDEGGLYDVRLTRDDDTFVPLSRRVEIGHELEADLFISIHADSVRRGQKFARGATVYTISDKASDQLAEDIAQSENMSDVIAGVELREEPTEVADILIDLARRETRSFSVHFARSLVSELESAVRLINNPHRSAGFRVLKAHDVPSVLVELGYLSNEHDEKLLVSDEWQQRMAGAMTEAVHGFFRPRLARQQGAPSQ
ncbi:N-acetylmuramoyl-L-alanine amidase [Roseibium sediminicola]|uniref:N-acetylmuramoyl-L-alanine amidase n=1 Tax=Roseibium sediminicola TaxID=2933272 RepID=A0ABT0GP43_9HYPH|nr:N-acetylmuramoyl-L-alanine amidase [Roseibium sp. CAU 1639]MCK7611192.1 N-acetylmuramoyl-L-alanine amidase [Roseibium sp. CAU 1639]